MTEPAAAAPEIHPAFGPALPALDWVPPPRYLMRRDRILALAAGLPAGRVLDIGCGAGGILHDLARRGFTGAGLERSPEARALGRAMHPSGGPVEIREAPGDGWAGAFDLVTSFEVLEHIEDDAAALAEWKAFLKPDGRLMISVPAHPELWNASDVWAGHQRRYTRAGLRAALEAAGFRVERLECYGYPSANVIERLRARACARQLEEAERRGMDADALTLLSGSDRSKENRLWPIYSSAAGTAAIRLACRVQRMFLDRDLGNGYLALARLA